MPCFSYFCKDHQKNMGLDLTPLKGNYQGLILAVFFHFAEH